MEKIERDEICLSFTAYVRAFCVSMFLVEELHDQKKLWNIIEPYTFSHFKNLVTQLSDEKEL